jgi:RNA polymerase sigma-70 factor (ECF subfamily)
MVVPLSNPRAFGMGNGKSAVAERPASASALEFDSVYETEFDYVYRVVSRLAGGKDVEDLVQEVFVVVHRRLPEYRGDARLTTWLFRIAYRVVGAHVRRDRLRRRVLHFFGFESEGPAPAFQRTEAERLHEARLVRAALERLSFEKRSALVLFEVEGWSGDEIAAAVGAPVATVYTRLLHARREFKVAYERLAGGRP